jgi:hypothetical protein
LVIVVGGRQLGTGGQSGQGVAVMTVTVLGGRQLGTGGQGGQGLAVVTVAVTVTVGKWGG